MIYTITICTNKGKPIEHHMNTNLKIENRLSLEFVCRVLIPVKH